MNRIIPTDVKRRISKYESPMYAIAEPISGTEKLATRNGIDDIWPASTFENPNFVWKNLDIFG